MTAAAPPADSALRDELAEALAAYNGRPAHLYVADYDRADIAIRIATAHLGQQQAAIRDALAYYDRLPTDGAGHRLAVSLRATLGTDR